jgi:hypothetical protein
MNGARYSDKEIRMLTNFVDLQLLDQTEPLTVYRVAVDHAFMKNINGPAADSLRRTMLAFHQGKPCRNTREFDDLITL